MAGCADKIIVSQISGIENVKINDSKTFDIQIHQKSLTENILGTINGSYDVTQFSETTLTYVGNPQTLYGLKEFYSVVPGLFNNNTIFNNAEYILVFQSINDTDTPHTVVVVIPIIYAIDKSQPGPTNLQDIFPYSDSSKKKYLQYDVYKNINLKEYVEYGGCNSKYGNFRVINYRYPTLITIGRVQNKDKPFDITTYLGDIEQGRNADNGAFASRYSGLDESERKVFKTREFKCHPLDLKKDIQDDKVLINPQTGERLSRVLTDINADNSEALGGGTEVLQNVAVIIAVIIAGLIAILFVVFGFKLVMDAIYRKLKLGYGGS